MIYLVKQSAVVIVLFLSCTSAFALSNGNEKENLQIISDKLEKAIEVRNFHVAREAVEELMPLMKEELKKNKKMFSELKKEDNPEVDPAIYQKEMSRKREIYNTLKKLVNISPAALRVKSESVKKDVAEFIKLT